MMVATGAVRYHVFNLKRKAVLYYGSRWAAANARIALDLLDTMTDLSKENINLRSHCERERRLGLDRKVKKMFKGCDLNYTLEMIRRTLTVGPEED